MVKMKTHIMAVSSDLCTASVAWGGGGGGGGRR